MLHSAFDELDGSPFGNERWRCPDEFESEHRHLIILVHVLHKSGASGVATLPPNAALYFEDEAIGGPTIVGPPLTFRRKPVFAYGERHLFLL